MSIAEQHESVWIATTPDTSYPVLEHDLTVDVAVLGGGIVGITAATLLKRAGLSVAVIEANRVARSVTGHTTAKLTSLHTLVYDRLLDDLGHEKAQMYGAANEAAIRRVADFVELFAIDCDFSRQPAYTYTERDKDVDRIQDEVNAAAALGLPATYTHDVPLPFPVKAAVRFDNQAQFHPRKYVQALAAAIPGEGSHVFEHTVAVDVDEHDERCTVELRSGAKLRSGHVVVATHMPFLMRGLYFAKATPRRAYVVCADIEPEQAPPGLFITSHSPTRSLRTVPTDDGALLLLSGEGHTPGDEVHTEQRYENLRQWARERYGVSQFRYRWSTQDYFAADGVPFVGPLTGSTERVFAATGFSSWGLTNGTAAAEIISNCILGLDNPWLEVYDSRRRKPYRTRKFVIENAKVAKHFTLDRFTSGDGDADDLSNVPVGGGRMLRIAGERRGVYRDENGTLHAVNPTCTHMGCLTHFNEAEKSWDCPCHGSRFGYDGTVLQGPATEPLADAQVLTPRSAVDSG